MYASARVTEAHAGYLELQVPVTRAFRLSRLFGLLEQLQWKSSLLEFSVSQTTLEHVFVAMVNEQQ